MTGRQPHDLVFGQYAVSSRGGARGDQPEGSGLREIGSVRAAPPAGGRLGRLPRQGAQADGLATPMTSQPLPSMFCLVVERHHSSKCHGHTSPPRTLAWPLTIRLTFCNPVHPLATSLTGKNQNGTDIEHQLYCSGECPTGSRKSAATVNTSYPTFCISAMLSSSRSRCAFSIQRCS